MLLLLLLLFLGLCSMVDCTEVPCEEVPWRPRRNVLFVVPDYQPGAAQQGMFYVAMVLAPEFHVEVAAPPTAAPALKQYRSLQIPIHSIDVGDDACNLMEVVAALHRHRHYVGLVWSVAHLFAAHLCVGPLPGAFSVLWVTGDKLGEGWSPEEKDWTLVLGFDDVVFQSRTMLVKSAALINPAGHLPISFRLLQSSNGTARPALTAFAQRVVTCLQHWAADGSDAHKRLMGHPSLVEDTGVAVDDAADMPETCPHNQFASLAVTVHLGRHRTERLHRVLSAMKDYPKAHLWVTYTHHKNRRGVLSMGKHWALFHPLMVRDHGLDIGPFFVFLWNRLRCHYRYSYILKYHYKSDTEHPFAKQAALFFKRGVLGQALQHLAARRAVSAVYPSSEGKDDMIVPYERWDFLGHNYDYIVDLFACVPVVMARNRFLAGSVWLTRDLVLTRWLHSPAQLWAIYTDLNGATGLDWRWYRRVVLHANCNRSAVQLHYFMKGQLVNKPPNCYTPSYSDPERDGMVEHAWERTLSYMLSHYGPFEPIIVQ